MIESRQRHPLVVHSGASPFVGSGSGLRTWSFAQRPVEAKPLGQIVVYAGLGRS
ncbi:hypothetical protein [Streptomyces flavofungini]|uniref:hypothetical protein n=1 Tax=Streptomyces flavofungini TaxID=68200 RepID=UPI0025AF662F|nr:hypothetical protein [Streptomyces flavofungini]WJV45459.1 hypothetical protein QUY26_07875 [Streptomyces flavofungini]